MQLGLHAFGSFENRENCLRLCGIDFAASSGRVAFIATCSRRVAERIACSGRSSGGSVTSHSSACSGRVTFAASSGRVAFFLHVCFSFLGCESLLGSG
jgi:hypothetical protein